jgi:hypothetical protein
MDIAIKSAERSDDPFKLADANYVLQILIKIQGDSDAN